MSWTTTNWKMPWLNYNDARVQEQVEDVPVDEDYGLLQIPENFENINILDLERRPDENAD